MHNDIFISRKRSQTVTSLDLIAPLPFMETLRGLERNILATYGGWVDVHYSMNK